MISLLVRHDDVRLALLNGDANQVTLYEARNGSPVVVSRGTPCLPRDLREAHIADDIRSDGCAWARVSAPVRIKEQAVGVLAFQARHPVCYTTDDLALLRRLAEYVAIAVSHQRLAESVHQARAERDRLTAVEASIELLRTISDRKSTRLNSSHLGISYAV